MVEALGGLNQEVFLGVRNTLDFAIFANACCTSNLDIVRRLTGAKGFDGKSTEAFTYMEDQLRGFIDSSSALQDRMRNSIDTVSAILIRGLCDAILTSKARLQPHVT
jgi:hypothetical protein